MMAEDERTLFTIGHSTHELAEFLRLLNVHGVEAVADVRSQPVSRLTHFDRDELADSLGGEGIEYVFLGRELGAGGTSRSATRMDRRCTRGSPSCLSLPESSGR